MAEDSSIWVGIDWASEAHQVCAIDGQRHVLLEQSVKHSGEALTKLIDTLLELAGGEASRLAVAIETPRSAVVEMLMERQIAVFAINPKQLDRFRDRHTSAGAKDDRRDAFVLADSLRTDMPSFRKVALGAAQIVKLRELLVMHDEARDEAIALANRIEELLRRYYVQPLALGSMHQDRWLWELLEKAPTPGRGRHFTRAKANTLLEKYGVRRLDADRVLEALRAPALGVAPGVAEACSEHLLSLLPRLRMTAAHQRDALRRIERLLEELPSDADEQGISDHRDARLLRSWPGLGILVCAAMIAEGWQPLRQRDYRTMRLWSGVAPVTVQSGKRKQVVMRHACKPRLQQAVWHWAFNAMKLEPRAKAHYQRLRAAGHEHARALRGVADRMLESLFAALRANETYALEQRSAA